jgi:hypothetical protein
LGASFDGDGVNFAVFSAHAERIDLCLFSPDGRKETARLPFGERDGDIWHQRVPGLMPGALYGFRAHGPYQPESGHRFNPNKLLIDPYARTLEGRLRWSDALMGYKVGSPRADLSFDTRDSAFAMPKSVVIDPAFQWGEDAAPQTALTDTVIYEAHVKGLTALHPGVPAPFWGCAPIRCWSIWFGWASPPLNCCPFRPLSMTAFWCRAGCAITGAIRPSAFSPPNRAIWGGAASARCKAWSTAFIPPGSR